MARNKRYDKPKPFIPATAQIKPDHGLPTLKARNEILSDSEALDIVARVCKEFRKVWYVEPVRSNKELMDRLSDYLEYVSARHDIPPTVEEMSAWCGVDYATMNDWKLGKRWFHDKLEGADLTTADIVKKAMLFMHGIDAALVEKNKMNTVAYIFRSKNYYGMQDKTEVTIESDNKMDRALTPAQIAANLPDFSVLSMDDPDKIE